VTRTIDVGAAPAELHDALDAGAAPLAVTGGEVRITLAPRSAAILLP
jgi:hypothetical protein